MNLSDTLRKALPNASYSQAAPKSQVIAKATKPRESPIPKTAAAKPKLAPRPSTPFLKAMDRLK